MLRPLARAALVIALMAPACTTLGVKTAGVSGPIAWQAIDLNTIRKVVEGQERDEYRFTLVLRNMGPSSLTITSVERTVYQADGGHAGKGVSKGIWEMKPGAEWKFPLYSYQFCNVLKGCADRATSAPMWNIILRGTDSTNRDVSIPVEIALPGVPAGKVFQGTPVGRSSPAEREATRVPAPAVPPAPAIVPKTTVTAPERTAATPAAAITAPVSGPRSSMIPIQVVENVVLVPVIFNGTHGATLLLDTGSQYTVITTTLAARLNLAPRPGAAKRAMTVVGGQSIEVPFVRLPALDIGNATLVDIEVGVYAVAPESPSIDGLLGGDVLSRYRVTVDHSARQLRLDPVPCSGTQCPP